MALAMFAEELILHAHDTKLEFAPQIHFLTGQPLARLHNAAEVPFDMKVTLWTGNRNHVFAQIKPATRTRIDLGFALGGRKAEGRLLDTGGYAKKDRITHRIPLESVADIDNEVKRWLKIAYEEDQ